MKSTELDPRLVPYCQAEAEAGAQQLLAQLATDHIEPISKAIVQQKFKLWSRLRGEEMADVHGEILLRLFQRLQQLRQGGGNNPIQDLHAYVAVVSYRGCDAYLRQYFPQRWRLQNRLRYLLTSQVQFQLCQEEDEVWIGGLANWDLATRGRLAGTRAQQLLEGRLPVSLVKVPDASFTRLRPEEQLQALLEWADCWVTLDELVAIFAQWWKLPESSTKKPSPGNEPPPTPLQHVEQRSYLEKIWQEIAALPLRQRQALLLNLRAGSNADGILLLPALGIANLPEIARVLEMPTEELLTLWPRLPLEDSEIAERLQIIRRQVINLRMVARKQLARRAKNW